MFELSIAGVFLIVTLILLVKYSKRKSFVLLINSIIFFCYISLFFYDMITHSTVLFFLGPIFELFLAVGLHWLIAFTWLLVIFVRLDSAPDDSVL
ncbi:MAG: hypothetical protein ACO3E1_06335 [Flavobacteriales bacterium]